MIRKRRSLSSSRSPKEVVPVSRARQVAPPARRRVATPDLEGDGRRPYVVPTTREAKQELILAHAHARRVHGIKPHGRFWVVFTVIATALVVFGGWWITFGKTLQEVSLGSDGLLQTVKGRSQELKEEVGSPTQEMREQLRQYEARQAAQSALLQQMAVEATNRQATGTATGTR